MLICAALSFTPTRPVPRSRTASVLRMAVDVATVDVATVEQQGRPLGQMERLLNARRSWSGAMTTAHVSAAVLEGPPPTEAELLQGLAWVLRRHPMLAACVRGKSKFHITDAQPYPMHSDYLGRAVAYNSELMRTYPDDDIQRFAPSSLPAEELAARALRVVQLPAGSGPGKLDEAWRAGFDEAMDNSIFDEDGDGPLWRITLYAEEGGGGAALLYAANHAVSDQLSFNRVLHEVLRTCAELRAGNAVAAPTPLPAPPSVEGALLGEEDRQDAEIKERLELIIGRFGSGGEGEGGGWADWLPSWEAGRAGLETVRYALWQMGASGAKVLPRWVPAADAIVGEAESTWQHTARRTKSALRTLDEAETAALVRACRARGVTASGALCAAAVLGASDAMGSVATATADDGEGAPAQERYKLLQALDMRTMKFGGGDIDVQTLKPTAARPDARDDWSEGTVIAGTGSLDILLDLPPCAGRAIRDAAAAAAAAAGARAADAALAPFWERARECNAQTRRWIASGWARESLLLFASGWEFMNMNRVVELGSQDRATLGRAYSAGVSNVGVYAHPAEHGDLKLSRIHFGISQTVSAPSISVSAVTVQGRLCLTVQYATPVWPEAEAERYADDLISMLRLAAAADEAK